MHFVRKKTTIADKETDLYFDSSEAPRKSLTFQNHFVGSDGNLSKPENNLFVLTICSFEQPGEPLWILAAPTEEARQEWLAKLSEAMATSNDKQLSRMSARSASVKATNAASCCTPFSDSLPPEIRDMLDF